MSCLSVFVLPSAIAQALLPDQAPSAAPVLGLPVRVAMGAAFLKLVLPTSVPRRATGCRIQTILWPRLWVISEVEFKGGNHRWITGGQAGYKLQTSEK